MRACNYNAPTGDSRLAIKTLLLNLPWRRRLRTPSPSSPSCSAACWFTAAFFLFLYEDRDVSKDSGVVFVSIARLRHWERPRRPSPHFCQSPNDRFGLDIQTYNPLTESLLPLHLSACVNQVLPEKMPFNTAESVRFRTSLLTYMVNIIAVTFNTVRTPKERF